MRIFNLPAAIVAAGLMLSSCQKSAEITPTAHTETTIVSQSEINQILKWKEEHKASSIGIGIIKNAELVWTGYYGEQRPGVPVTETTMFNTASVSKAITAELAVRLLDQGKITLDEPISEFYVHPDLIDDPRHNQLTPRILLSHTTGFLNWPHHYEDGKLSFTRDPGTAYGYSGVGFDIFAKFLENKLGMTFPELVSEYVFDPIGMENASQVQADWMRPFQVLPVDQNGDFKAAIENENGFWNPADDYYATINDHARFLIAVMNNEGLTENARQLRTSVLTSLEDDMVWGCQEDMAPCPEPFGHSVGYFVFGYGDRLNIQHGGNDMSEAATGYFKTNTRDGMVVFVNAPNPEGIFLYLKIVDLLDDDQDFTQVFHSIANRYFSGDAEE